MPQHPGGIDPDTGASLESQFTTQQATFAQPTSITEEVLGGLDFDPEPGAIQIIQADRAESLERHPPESFPWETQLPREELPASTATIRAGMGPSFQTENYEEALALAQGMQRSQIARGLYYDPRERVASQLEFEGIPWYAGQEPERSAAGGKETFLTAEGAGGQLGGTRKTPAVRRSSHRSASPPPARPTCHRSHPRAQKSSRTPSTTSGTKDATAGPPTPRSGPKYRKGARGLSTSTKGNG